MNSNIPYTGSELAFLWRSYQSETLAQCTCQRFAAILTDEKAKSLALQLLKEQTENIKTMKNLFESEKIPVPYGTTDEDLNNNSPRLFTEGFIIQYMDFMLMAALEETQSALFISSNESLRTFYINRLRTFASLQVSFTELLLEKGLFIRTPFIPYPKQVEFVQDKGLLGELFGEKRPLSALEVHHLFLNSIRNALGKVLMTAFWQCTKSDDIRTYFERGKKLSEEFMDLFNSILQENDLLPTSLNDLGVTDTSESPFSERLMLRHVVALNSIGLSYYGISLAEVSRSDVYKNIARVLLETQKFSADGITLLVKKGYLEQPPFAPDRAHLK